MALVLAGRLGRLPGRISGRFFTRLNGGEQLIALDHIPFLLENLFQHAVIGRDHFQYDFIGLDIHQEFVPLNRIPGLLVPGRNRPLLNGFGKGRGLDFDTHRYFLSISC